MSTLPKTDFKVERLDDIPLLLEQLKHMEIPSLVDENIKTHGNWQGLSLGWTVTIWLAHILSEADHCLCHVQPWVASHLEALKQLTGIDSLQELDFTDDRLESVLRYLNKDDNWKQYEQSQGKRLIRVYDLNQKVVRIDASTGSTFQAENSKGLLRKGVSKDHRPDLAQLKFMLSSLDPLGLPLATQVVPGNTSDDPLYIPAIEQVRAVLNRSGVLYVGDCKMAALKTRATIQNGSDYSLTPLPKTIVPFEELNDYLLSFYQLPKIEQESKLKQVYKKDKKGNDYLIAKGFEQTKQISTELDGKTITFH
jgi:transposase